MPKQIYNEGRVVGLSAYEIFIREYLSEGNENPPSEREWLASTLAFGSSMLLRVPEVTPADGTEDTQITIDFPNNSNLCAANTIIASFFNGSARVSVATVSSSTAGATVGNAYWGTQVYDYGELISNTATLNPTDAGSIGGRSDVPVKASLEWTDIMKSRLNDYMKVVDGIILQPGTWTTVTPASNKPPEKSFSPDMSKSPQVRLHIHGAVTAPFWILLTGFTLRAVVVGETGLDTSVGTDSPEDGDFLGPACFPWANKIVFSVPSSAVSSLLAGEQKYTRSIAPVSSLGQTATVNDSAIIDLKFGSTIYANWQNSLIDYTATELHKSGDGAAILGVFPRSDDGFRGLYASRITETGAAKMEPIDCHAPGSVKGVVCNADDPGPLNQMVSWNSYVPYSMLLFADQGSKDYNPVNNSPYAGDDQLNIRFYRPGDTEPTVRPVAAVTRDNNIATTSSSTNSIINNPVSNMYNMRINTGSKIARVLALSDTNGNLLAMDGSSRIYSLNNSVNNGNMNWEVLLAALSNNGSVDILGNRMKQLKTALTNLQDTTQQYAIVLSGNTIGIEPVAALPNFFFITLDCDSVNYTSGATNVYDGVRMDIFGFSTDDASSTGLVNTFGTLTALQADNYSFNGNAYNWFQPFSVKKSYQSQFNTLITRLNPAGISGLNMIKISCVPVTNYRSQSGNVDNGAPISNVPNVWAAYMNATDGNSTYEEGDKYDGILYVRNSGSTQNVSQVSVLCSMALYKSGNRPRCRRSKTANSGYLTW